MHTFSIILLCLSLFALMVQTNPLDHVIAHAHVRGGRLHACPDSLCEMDTTTKLYFWIVKGERIPNMFLRTRSNTEAVTITTSYVRHPALKPRLTKQLKNELLSRSGGRELQMLEAEFPNDQMMEVTYTFLMTNDYISWIAADMICQRVTRILEPIRRGHRLVCSLDKRDWTTS